MPKKPSRRRRVIAEALESRLLFSATADFALLDDGHSEVDYLSHTAINTDLTTIFDLDSVSQEQTFTFTDNVITQDQIDVQDSAYLGDSQITDYSSKALIFVDTSVADYQTLVEDIQAQSTSSEFEIVLIDANENGIEQITAALSQLAGVGAIHLVSHGKDGRMQLGSTVLDNDSIKNYKDDLASWKNALGDDADILIYGCNLAANDDGLELINDIATLTDADVASSNDLTGANSLGGDWDLEVNQGEIDTQTLFSESQNLNWQGLLAGDIPVAADDSISIWFDETIEANVISGVGGTNIILDDLGAEGPGTIVSVTYDSVLYNVFDGFGNLTINTTTGTFVITEDGTFTFATTATATSANPNSTPDWETAFDLYGYNIGTSYLNGGVIDATSLANSDATVYQSSDGLGIQGPADAYDHLDNNSGSEAIVVDLKADYGNIDITTTYLGSAETLQWTVYDSSGIQVDTGSFSGLGGGGASDYHKEGITPSGEFRYVVFTVPNNGDGLRIYELTAGPATPGNEVFDYVVEDLDGDTDTGQLTISYADDNNNASTGVAAGIPTEGNTLTAGFSDSDGISSAVNYQWQRSSDGSTGWSDIGGATSNTYTLVSADAGNYVRFNATYTDDQGTQENTNSYATSQIAGTSDPGSISFSGTPTEDQTLTASISDDDGFSGETYQWERSADGSTGWTSIGSATNSTYTLTDADVGQYVRVTASYTDDGATAESPVSSSSAQIANINDTSFISFSGTETEDQTLTSAITDNDGATGSISYQWERSANGSTGWTSIGSATNSTYTLTDTDVGQYVRVTASYTDDEGTAETPVSSASGQIANVNDTSSISFSGTETEDQTLTANIVDADGFSGETYQWQRSADGSTGWTNIGSATNATYTLTDADVGQYVRVTASYTDDGATAESPVSSASGQIANVNDTSNISFSGTETEDQTLTAAISDNDGATSSISYQWERSANGSTGWTSIGSATNSTYTLTDADVDQYVRITASYTDDEGTAETPVSFASGQIANVNDTSSISFSGTETEDQTLAAAISDNDGATGSISYQWERSANGSTGWTSIGSATNSTYTLTDTDVGQYVRVTASYTDDEGTAETPISSASGQIANVNDTSNISFSGTETEDQALTAAISDNDGATGSISYQWQRSADGSTAWTNIGSATNTTYALTDADVGQYVRVTASYTDDEGTAETPVSSASGQIANVNDTSSISFSGTETEDQTLTAAIADNDGATGSISYQWERSANGSTGWTSIGSATNSTYTLTDTDVGQYVRVTAGYTDDEGTAETPVSSASGQITNVNDTSSISFSGTETEDQTLTANIVDADSFSGETYQWQRSADGSTGWTNIGSATNATYTLTDADVGQYVRVTASYTDDGATAESPVSSASGQIANVNDTSNISFSGTETEDQTLTAAISDNDGATGSISYQWQRSADGSTAWTNIGSATNTTYALTDADVGRYVRVTASYTDDEGTLETPVSISSGQIGNVNDTASISFSGTETEDQTLTAAITDADGFSGETYQWQRSADGSTGWTNITSATSSTYTLTDADVGQYVRVTGIFTDNYGTAEMPVSLTSGRISNLNDDPVLVTPIANQSSNEDSVFNFTIPANTFFDTDGDTLIFSAQLAGGAALPAWLIFDSVTQTFSGTPDVENVGSISIEVFASDGNGGMNASNIFGLIINAVNDQPLAPGIANFAVDEDTAISLLDMFGAFDDEEDADSNLTYQLVSNSNNGLVNNVSMDSITGQLQLTYTANQFGSSTITLRATDSQGASIDSSFTVTVNPVNDNPTATAVPETRFVQGTQTNSQFTLANIFNDVEDGSNLTFTVQGNSNPNLTQAVAIDTQSGELVLSYNQQTTGQTIILIRATDSMGAWIETPINVTIVAKPEPPVTTIPEDPLDEVEAPPETSSPADADDVTEEPDTEGEPSTPTGSNNLDDNLINASDISTLANNLGTAPASFGFEQAQEYQRADDNKQKISEAKQQYENQVKPESNLASLVAFDNMSISDQDIIDFNNELKKFKHDVEEAVEEEKTQKAIFAGITVSITTGIIIWALRAGSLFLTLFSILPLWKGFDPLPVLTYQSRKKDLEKQRKDKLEEDKQRREVGYLFDNKSNDSKLN